MGYLTKFSSLEERASAQVAINLCQDYSFKETALGLEKPIYGALINVFSKNYFITNPELLSRYAEVKGKQNCDVLMEESLIIENKEGQWNSEIDEQCQRLTKGLPLPLKHGIIAWINRIALEYLSYSRRLEKLFGISPYFLMEVLTLSDWLEDGQLDHIKLVKRFLQNEQFTVLQRYCIACVYWQPENIFEFWKKLTQEERQSVAGDKSNFSQKDPFVSYWSNYMKTQENEKIVRILSELPFHEAICYGNKAVVKQVWKEIDERTQRHTAVHWALVCLEFWQHNKYLECLNWKKQLLWNQMPTHDSEYIQYFNLPCHYSDLLLFFLFEMHEEQQLTFFKQTFWNFSHHSLLDLFLDWPFQDYFLPIMNQLWGIAPKDIYEQCLLTLVKKCQDTTCPYEKRNRYYDYQSMLWTLWEKTPAEYKQYLFDHQEVNIFRDEESVPHEYVKSVIVQLLLLLLKRSPFTEKDEKFLKRIWHEMPQEEKKLIVCSYTSIEIFLLLTRKGKWYLMNYLLEESLPKEEIPGFKKGLMQSIDTHKYCLYKLESNCEKHVEDFINWAFELNAEKMQFKYEVIDNNVCLHLCESLLRKGRFTEVECIINFCLLSDKIKKQAKVKFAEYACNSLLEKCAWEQIDGILVWAFETEDKIKDFKMNLIVHEKYLHL